MSKAFTAGALFKPSTLVEMLQNLVEVQPDLVAFTFLNDGEDDATDLTLAQLDRQARAIGAWLQAHVERGDRALLLYPPGLEFIATFFGCLYAGVVAVPVYPPRLNRPSARIEAIVHDSGATVALTTRKISESLARRFEQMPELARLQWLVTADIPVEAAEEFQRPAVTEDSLAFLQYTSGSTGKPKGVMLSHGNLVHNLEVIYQGFRPELPARGVFWLPNYHDMGMIGGILEPIYVGGHAVLMAPVAFLQKPVRWLQAVSHYRATISGAPNFAYQLCVDKISPEQREGLDLSSWQIAFCGAEPVRLKTLNAFAEAFAPCGFRQNAFYPCYGLAEATLLVAGGDGPASPRALTVSKPALEQQQAQPVRETGDETVTLVSCGHVLGGQEIAIVEPETCRRCRHGEVGEIWVSGPSVAEGYWSQEERSLETFKVQISGEPGATFLRTGDLGFVYEGELYVTGRLKDLIIIRGRNLYPQDIELTVAEAHVALEPGMGAAFSVEVAEEERLVVVCELTRRHRKVDMDEVSDVVRRAVAREHGVQLHALVLIRPLSMPRTSSGKIRRFACKNSFQNGTLAVVGEWHAPVAAPIEQQTEAMPVVQEKNPPRTAEEIRRWLVARLAGVSQTAPAAIDPARPFVEYGLDSVQAVSLVAELEAWLGQPLAPTLVWDFPTIQALVAHLAREEELALPVPVTQRPNETEPIAVVGLSCRFPGAPSPEAFWQLLQQGVDGISEVPSERWQMDAYYAADPEPVPGKMSTRWAGLLDNIDRFDADFFGISPREAARMDPQQRLLLEVTWEALERAVQNPLDLSGSATGVFVGISTSDYSQRQFGNPAAIDGYAGTGNAHSIAANRLSYTLDLQGPSVAVDTACSSSLVAVHLAAQSLRNGESDLALAGGVNLILAPGLTVSFSQARMMAADGRCKTFDAAADGYVRGEGCGIVVLKRLTDAERDGDPVLAVIRGSAVNQDGRSNGLTAPNGRAQQAVIRRALANAGVDAVDIDYVETHGTGTRLGDPIEVAALQSVFDGVGEEPLRLGSVKTNIGHLEAAAGIAGLIKTILALQHEYLPPHLHFRVLNPHISLAESRLQILTDGRLWPRRSRSRLAGISSFGFGGTNAHLVIQEAPLPALSQNGQRERPRQLIALSAASETALRELAAATAGALAAEGAPALSDACFSANTGRAGLSYRIALHAATREEMVRRLHNGAAAGRPLSAVSAQPKVAFLFTGQGAQYPAMARGLFDTQPVFREALARCAQILEGELAVPLLDLLYSTQTAAEITDQTEFTQPVLFAVEYALAELWQSWGVKPDVVLGHSVGELVAACIAGVMTLEDALQLTAARGRMMGALPPGGAMAAVFAAEDVVAQVVAAYPGKLSIAAVNGPDAIVLSGAEVALDEAAARLAADGVEVRRLQVSHAFHSPLLAPMLDELERAASSLSFSAPRLPLISNVTGELAEGPLSGRYWRDHARRPVRFADAMATAVKEGATVFVEIGPQPHLTGMARRFTDGDFLWLASLRRDLDDWEVILESLGRLYEAGVQVDWRGFDRPYSRRKVLLPTYPFQRQRHWLDVESAQTGPWPVPANDVTRRLPTALPLFDTTLTVKEGVVTEQLLSQHLRQVANLFWGEGAHIVEQLALAPGAGIPQRPFRLQTHLQPLADDMALVQSFSAEEPGERWRLVATGQVRRVAVLEPVQPANGHAQASQVPAVGEALSREALLALGPSARQTLLAEWIAERVAHALGVEQTALDRNRPLDTLGLDSLMARDIKNAFERILAVDVPVVLLLQGPSAESLAEKVVGLLEAPVEQRAAILPLSDPAQPAPLTANQEAMWILHQLLPPELAFNVAGAARVRGALDLEVLNQALQDLVARHGALRTTFRFDDGQPVQQEHPQLPVQVTVLEAAARSEADVLAYLEREAHRPFDLEHGPLMRLIALIVGPEEQILLLSLSHLIADFWSISLLVEELWLLYQAGVQKAAVSLPELPLRAADVARWQREMLSSEEEQAHQAYWLEKLSGNLPRLDLPSDRPRPAVQVFHGDTTRRTLDARLTEDLKALSARYGVTLATTLLASFQTLLHRLTGHDDLIVGSVVSGRERAELQRLIGYLVNSVPLRANFYGDPTVSDILGRTQETVLEAMAHQDYPLPRLAAQLAAAQRLQVDGSRPPLFETMFIMQRAQLLGGEGFSAFALGLDGAAMSLGELEVEAIAVGGLPAQFDLTLMMAETADELAAALHYNTALFDSETAERFLASLEALLRSMAAAPEQPVSRLNLLPAEERRRLLMAWNQTDRTYPAATTLHELVSEQAAATPARVALRFKDNTLTYAALERRSNQLARVLCSAGVGPEQLVGVLLERSEVMVVALLAVLKAGGAYIPLDPDFPAERLSLMIEDARPQVLMTDSGVFGELGLLLPEDTVVIALDEDQEVFLSPADSEPHSGVTADNLAYVIYTSGSTGRPKGVQITHRAAVNFLSSMRAEPGVAADDHLLAVTTLSFDIALLELFLPLITGGQVTVAPRELALDGVMLAKALDDLAVTVMQATPATWRLLLESGWSGRPEMKILCGGEALTQDLARALLPRCRELWNMYGPTETTVWSTIEKVQCADEPISVGRPIANTQAYVLDDALQPVPVGVVGHLYIGGAGVSRGYWGQPELTAARFRQNPFAAEADGAGEIIYHTGDLARYLPDGRLLLLGRDDFQVKVRGYRIELGDIENALLQHPRVRQAVVMVREEQPEQRSLVAYVLGRRDGPPPTAEDLRSFLRQKLPAYMLPAHFVSLTELPLTPNGKINRSKLPAPALHVNGHTQQFVAPRDELEHRLAALCANVLGRERVGVTDNFFEIGGNSLLATRLVFLTREQFGVQVPLRQLFQQPTVAGLAAALQAATANGNGHSKGELPALERMPTLAEMQVRVSRYTPVSAGSAARRSGQQARHILLTGATGFLGAFLLRDLLRDSGAVVHCLVRAASPEEGWQRLFRNLTAYDLEAGVDRERIVPLLGDLSMPHLGLDEHIFAALAQQIDLIIHNGALVNFVYGYEQHEAINVNGTYEILRLAAQHHLKPVHFVSTLSVFHSGGHDQKMLFREDDDLAETGVPLGGYAQSKWVAEHLVQEAGRRGVPVAVYRPGLVSGSSLDGGWNTEDMMSTMAATCAALGAVPELDVMVDLVPVDYVSKAIVALALQREPAGDVYHLANPSPLAYAELLTGLREAGLALQSISFDAWREKLLSMAGSFGGAGWNPYLPLVEEVSVEQVFMPAVDCSNTLSALAGSGVVCPPVDQALLATYAAYFQRRGLLPAVAAGPGAEA